MMVYGGIPGLRFLEMPIRNPNPSSLPQLVSMPSLLRPKFPAQLGEFPAHLDEFSAHLSKFPTLLNSFSFHYGSIEFQSRTAVTPVFAFLAPFEAFLTV